MVTAVATSSTDESSTCTGKGTFVVANGSRSTKLQPFTAKSQAPNVGRGDHDGRDLIRALTQGHLDTSIRVH